MKVSHIKTARNPNRLFNKKPAKPHDELEGLLKSLTGPLNLYQIMSKSENLLKISVPPTLIHLDSHPTDSIFLNNTQNILSKININSINDFFSLPKNPLGLPLYFYTDSTSEKLCFSTKSALKSWNSSEDPSRKLQKFIYGSFKIPSKIRLYWSFSKGCKHFLIRNLQSFPKIIPEESSLKQVIPSIYKHSLSDYSYAGQILKSSFNSFMPQKSSLTKKKNQSHKFLLENEKNELFKCKFSSGKTSVLSMESIDESIRGMTENIIIGINDYLKITEKKILTDLVLDFIQDENGKWLFLKIKSHRSQLFSVKSDNSEKKNIVNSDYAKGFYRTIFKKKVKRENELNHHDLSIESFQKRLDNISDKMKVLQRRKDISLLSPLSMLKKLGNSTFFLPLEPAVSDLSEFDQAKNSLLNPVHQRAFSFF